MSHPGAVLHPLEKPTGFSHAAAMFINAGKRFSESFIKPTDFICWFFLQFANIQQHLDAGSKAPVIRP
jgi:hypothetical protein